MVRWLRVFAWSAVPIACLAARERELAQVASGPSEPGATLVKLASLDYPPIARAARVSGEVKLTVTIRPDGTVESASVLSGPPMLAEGALANARKSQYACSGCAETSQYEITYVFKFLPGDPPKDCNQPLPTAPPSTWDAATRQATAFAPEIWTCDPAVTYRMVLVRSFKCLYLWKCSKQTEPN